MSTYWTFRFFVLSTKTQLPVDIKFLHFADKAQLGHFHKISVMASSKTYEIIVELKYEISNETS